MKEALSTCSTLAACDQSDGQRVIVTGVYRLFPDKPGVDYTGVPRAVRIELDGGGGPLLEPYWDKQAIRPSDEVARYQGKRVRVTGRYLRLQPKNPADPPYASAMGGPCIHPVEGVELAE